MSNGTRKVAPKKKSKKQKSVDAAIAHVKQARKKQGNKKKKIPRAAIEAAIRNDTGLTRSEVDAALAETYDDIAALGMLPPRRVRANVGKKKKKGSS